MNEWKEYKLSEAPLEIIDGDRGNNYPSQHEFLTVGTVFFLAQKMLEKMGLIFQNVNLLKKKKMIN